MDHVRTKQSVLPVFVSLIMPQLIPCVRAIFFRDYCSISSEEATLQARHVYEAAQVSP